MYNIYILKLPLPLAICYDKYITKFTFTKTLPKNVTFKCNSNVF